MFEYLKGVLAEKYNLNNSFYFVIDVNGVGYQVEVSESDYNYSVNQNEEVKIYIKLIHKEDFMGLCGFIKRESRDIFNYLTSVSGVGTKMALGLLGQFNTYDLITLVINEDFKQLTLAKGVGMKLAQKIVLELRDKLLKSDISNLKSESFNIELSSSVKETTSILLSLGYSDEEIQSAFNVVLQKCKNKDDSEELLRESLKYLSM